MKVVGTSWEVDCLRVKERRVRKKIKVRELVAKIPRRKVAKSGRT